jgi:biopolymer transport protein TolR
VPVLRPGFAHRPLSEINVTPFVDVMLVLLIIFMVTAPMMQQGIDVDLPETTTQNIRIRDEPLVLTVKKDGTYYLARKDDRKEIFLRADKDVRYEAVVKAMAAARQAGATKLGVVAEPEA